MYTIYEVLNTVTGDTYVGLTRHTPQQRWVRHLYNARLGMDTYLYRAVRKYGAASFSFRAVASVLVAKDAGHVERQVIQSLSPAYNQTNGGEVTIGRRVSSEVVAKIAASNTGKRRTEEQKAANSALKKQQFAASPMLQAKTTAALQKARMAVNEVKRLAAVKAALVGKPLSAETRAKISAKHLGLKHTPDVLKRISESHKRPVLCNTLHAAFDSVSEAAEATGLSVSGVSSVCRKKRKAANGLVFSFA